ncbi:MAG: tetratricopeptide repeat protein [Planctomycetota bacterium]|jgi:DNA-directed RNA polymerase subunit alpha|nr:MAG: tetratricopeptide repeat protein [Planctomycetota bacterium]
MVATARLDIRDLITGSGPFGPTEVKAVLELLGTDAAAHRDLRSAVRDLESISERSPASSVKLGVCQRLLGKARDALETLKGGDGGALALFHQGLAHIAEGAHDKACELFESARKAGYDAAACVAASAESMRSAGKPAEAHKALDALGSQGESSADFWAARAGVLADSGHGPAEVAAACEKAIAIDPGHPGALFLLGVIADRVGNEDDAKGYYERSLARYPASVGALINLGILYEDNDDFTKAQQCYRRVLEAFPDHPRARLFLKDSSASGDLQLDEQEMKQRDRLDQVLCLPVSDFELSVRSRNCLQKMGIHTLGDLARTTEEEILASKNFGETSLVEIRDMLSSKGLSLGQIAQPVPAADVVEVEAVEPSADEQEVYSMPINDLNLSVRARKCTTKLGITTIGDLIRRTAEDLLECKNFGVTSLNEVREKLTERGLKLRGD